ncbi:Nitrosoguanidine resistance protein SNG1 [Leucoagaricus sp. SymC.cos]|nr:Nitrosoguanidine resistance protein SNG1 [Leucoagaricus sp. SymC.cos]
MKSVDDTPRSPHKGQKPGRDSNVASFEIPLATPLFQYTFLSRNPSVTTARKLYFKFMLGGLLAISFIVFGIFPILYGAFYKTPERNLPGWIVDFDGGVIGQSVIAGLTAPNPVSKVTWNVVTASQFPGGVADIFLEVAFHSKDTVNPGASTRLSTALSSPHATYDGSEAISVYGAEARNENAYRGILLPSIQVGLTAVSVQFALRTARMVANSTILPQLLATSPQTITTPIAFQVFNLRPFDQPVASVVVFVGQLFVLILSFFVVVYHSPRSAFRRHSSYISFLPSLTLIQLFDCLLALAFQLNTTKKFGRAGFMVLWMLNWMGMCAMGLAMEAMLSLMTPPGVAFFLLIWIMVNVAVTAFPIEVLPIIYRYGYAMPFYNIGKATRTIIFATKNRVGMCFGILFAWVLLSCVTTWIFGYLSRQRDIAETRRQEVKVEERVVNTRNTAAGGVSSTGQ